MKELIRHLPKFDPIRTDAAFQIRTARYFDRNHEYITDRDLSTYLERFQGLDAFFEYVRTVDKNGIVLDVGAGSTRAISEIQSDRLGRGLQCIATVLTPPPIDTGLDRVDIKQTSASVLAGIENDSVSGILSCYGISYSRPPSHTIHRLDEVLKDSGVIKALFPVRADLERGNQRADIFLDELFSLGYNIALAEYMAGEIVVAVKPGRKQISAYELLLADSQTMELSGMILMNPDMNRQSSLL